MADELNKDVILLHHPIELKNGDTIEQLEFREGRGSDCRGLRQNADGIDWDTIFTVASRQTGQPVTILHRLHADDLGEVSSRVVRFLARCLTTGSED